jgi:hypothetical protein
VGTVNVALAESPVLPVTVTGYEPAATEPTLKDPVTLPLDTEHVGDVTKPALVEDIVQVVVSDGLKFEPETVTVPPGADVEGLSMIVGTGTPTLNVA